MRKNNILICFQICLFVICFILGCFYFSPKSDRINVQFISMLTKLQSSNFLGNVCWLFSHNFSIMLIIYLMSYLTFGVIGTLWCSANSFMIGALMKIYVTMIHNNFVDRIMGCSFMAIEFACSVAITSFSTYFRIEDHKQKKIDKVNSVIVIDSVAVLLLISAIIESMIIHMYS